MLPNLLIIGAQKAATTSLHAYLDAHPQIAMSKVKELNFFGGPGFATWERGLAWYEEQFPVAAEVRGESSPNYTFHPVIPGVPERIHGIIPNTKLIYMVRDPVQRMLSQWQHVAASGRERRPFREILAEPDFARSGYVMKSRYAYQIDQYRPFFGDDQLLVLSQEALLEDPRAVLSGTFRFLGVGDSDVVDDELRLNVSTAKRRTRGVARRVGILRRATERAGSIGTVARALLTTPVPKPDLSVADRRRLEDLVREDAQRLRAMTGLPLEGWSV